MLECVEKLENGFDGKRVVIERHRVKSVKNGHSFIYEIAKVKDAIAVLPILSNGNVVLIENFRYPVGQTIIEVPAGLIEENEDVIEAAKRELKEETGYECGKMEKVGEIYTSPGLITEKIHLFVATKLSSGKQELELSEDIKVLELPLDKAIWMVVCNQIKDVKAINLIMRQALFA